MSDARLERIRARFGKLDGCSAESNSSCSMSKPAATQQFTVLIDDIVSMVPSPDLIAQTLPSLAENGVYNIFAGVAKGITAELDLGTILAKNQRLIGTSGFQHRRPAPYAATLVESEALSTNASLAAIGGLDAFRDGSGRRQSRASFPGKTVIFPHIDRHAAVVP